MREAQVVAEFVDEDGVTLPADEACGGEIDCGDDAEQAWSIPQQIGKNGDAVSIASITASERLHRWEQWAPQAAGGRASTLRK